MAPYTYAEEFFGIPAPNEGEEGTAAEEQAQIALIGALFARMLDAVGVGVISGGAGSIVGDDLSLSAIVALAADDLGAVPVTRAAEVIAASEFPSGVSYVHLQLGANARGDGTDCGYYISASGTPASDALAIVKVTKAGGVVTAVDNTVKALPAIEGRLTWEDLKRSYQDSTTLLAMLTAMLGARYLAGTAPDDVDTRLVAVETGGGGGGGGGTVYWWDLQRSASLTETIAQYLLAQLAQHVTDYHAATVGGGGVTTVAEPWDEDAVNFGLAVLTDVAMDNPLAGQYLIDCVVVVDGVYGDGSNGTADFIDHVNSDF